jgi:adhesin transport system membrane fusion protein
MNSNTRSISEAIRSSPPGIQSKHIAGMRKPRKPYIHDSGPRWVLRILILSILTLLLWAAFSEIDQVTRAPAQVVSQFKPQQIQTSDGGVIEKLHVQEGDIVQAGQVLVSLDRARAEAAVADIGAKVVALEITLNRLEAEVYGKTLAYKAEHLSYPEYVRNQTELFRKRQSLIKDELTALEQNLRIAESELRMNSELQKSGDIGSADVLRFQRNVADISAQITNRRNKYFQDAQAEMTKAQEDLNTQSEMLQDRKKLLEHTQLLAPMAGIVNNIHATTLGGVVRPGDTVLELTPLHGDLVVEAKISTSDIAFVEIGQSAFVKLDAYDSSVYGSINGTVIYISTDVIKEDSRQGSNQFYKVRVSLDEKLFINKPFFEVRLKPGLTGNVEIKAKSRTVLSYLTKPISKTFGESFKER